MTHFVTPQSADEVLCPKIVHCVLQNQLCDSGITEESHFKVLAGSVVISGNLSSDMCVMVWRAIVQLKH